MLYRGNTAVETFFYPGTRERRDIYSFQQHYRLYFAAVKMNGE